MKTIIELRNITKNYQMGKTEVNALRGVNLVLQEGKYYSIVGSSGSGKSTLMHIIGCMDAPSTGEVWVDGVAVHDMNETQRTQIRATTIGFIFQAFHLNPILTVLENVAIAAQFLGIPSKTAKQRAKEWLTRVGLEHRIHHYPSELSGGEQQRVAIARALIKEPKLILADEPTGNLDSKTGLEIILLMQTLNKESGSTILQVTHDSEIAEMSDQIIYFKDGLIEQ